jgi:hypothetical protein
MIEDCLEIIPELSGNYSVPLENRAVPVRKEFSPTP